MIPVVINVHGTVNVHLLHVSVGAAEILRVQCEMSMIREEEILPERVYRLYLRYSAN